MAKINELRLEARVLGEVKTKAFQGGKQVHEWGVGIGAKQADGTWKNVFLSCKKWGDTLPQRGQDIIMTGSLKAETWGEDSKKIYFNVDSFEVIGDANQQNDPLSF